MIVCRIFFVANEIEIINDDPIFSALWDKVIKNSVSMIPPLVAVIIFHSKRSFLSPTNSLRLEEPLLTSPRS
jgi:hypothetical protein